MTRAERSLRRPLSHVVVRGAPLALLLAVVGCGGAGLDCGSGCANAYPYPQTATTVPNGTAAVDDGIRVRLTQAGLDFVVANLRPVLAAAFGGEQNGQFRVVLPPGQLAGATVEYGRGSTDPFEEYPATVIVDAEALGNNIDVELIDAANAVRVTFTDIPVGVDMRLFSDWGLGNAACDLKGTSPEYGAPYLTGLSLQAEIAPRVGRGAECDEAGGVGECIKIDVDIIAVDINPANDLDSADIELDTPASCPGSCGTFSCSNQPDGPGGCSEACSDTRIPFVDETGGAECTGVCTIADVGIDVVFELIGVIEPLIGGLLDEAVELAVTNALEDIDGAPISFAQRQDVAGFAPGILPASALDLGLAIAPTTGAFDVNAPTGGSLGLDLILKSGFEAAPPLDASEGLTVPHPCARPIAGVNFANLYGGAEFEVPDNLLAPLTGTYEGSTYHLGASLAKPAVNQVLFALYNTGALCLEIDSDAVNTLAGGQFQLSAATLDLLTGGKLKQFAAPDAPAILVVNPSQPPVVTYGAGTVDEGHLIINWPDVEVGFYVLMFERFSRVFAVTADISLQIAVFDDPDTRTLKLSVVDGPNITGFEQTYSELLPGVDFTEVLSSLLGTVLDTALGDGLEFDFDIADALSGALGGAPIFIDLNGIETVPATDREFLNIYLTMSNTAPQPRTVRPTSVRLADEPGVLRRIQPLDGGRTQVQPTGLVRIAVADDDAEDREYFARSDFGMWRGPLAAVDGVVTVPDAKLRLTGEHAVTIRSRLRGVPGSLESEGTTLTVWVDGVAPSVRLQRVGDELVARGTDDGTVPGGLVWSWQLDDGSWSDFGTTATLALDEVRARRVAVRAQDLAGNVSRVASVDIGVEELRRRTDREAPASTFDGGCSAAGATTSAAPVALAFTLLLLRRRRRNG